MGIDQNVKIWVQNVGIQVKVYWDPLKMIDQFYCEGWYLRDKCVNVEVWVQKVRIDQSPQIWEKKMGMLKLKDKFGIDQFGSNFIEFDWKHGNLSNRWNLSAKSEIDQTNCNWNVEICDPSKGWQIWTKRGDWTNVEILLRSTKGWNLRTYLITKILKFQCF